MDSVCCGEWGGIQGFFKILHILLVLEIVKHLFYLYFLDADLFEWYKNLKNIF